VIAAVLASGILSRTKTPAPVPEPGLSLTVSRDGDSLRVAWDRAAPAVANARRAILSIQDGSGQAQIDLDRDRLREGSVAYVPKSGDVTFRLEVFTATASASESARAPGLPYASATVPPAPAIPELSPAPEVAEPAKAAEPSKPAAPPTPPKPAPPAKQAAPRPGRGSAQRVVQTPAAIFGRMAATRPATSLLPDPPPVIAPTVAAPPAAAAVVASLPSDDTNPFCRVTVVPVSHSRMARVFGKLVGRPGVSPPSPLRDPAPVVPPDVRQRISGAVEIDVRVVVGATGAVEDAELLSKGKDAALADLALFASRRSQFAPARAAGQDVSSEVVLRYRFGSQTQ
jgi:outer membrane biosynthesis protein TonB